MNNKMKIQPIDSPSTGAKPVVARSRFRRLFRIPGPGPGTVGDEEGEVGPSSVCLGKMVLNYMEESSEKQQVSVRCGRNRCNCFNASDCDDLEIHGVFTNHVCGFLKSMLMCASVNERNVLADTVKVMADNRACKRKDELRKLVVEGLMALGYDAGICKSKWEKSPSFPAGEYEYVDVVVGGERLIIDIAFRAEFEVARSTKTYKSVLQTLPNIFVGKSDRLSKIICILSEAAKQSLKKKGMDVPPWRKVDYVQAKWLSPPTRLIVNSATVTPPPSLLTPVNSLIVSDGPSPDKSALLTEAHPASESEASSGSAKSETLFNMSESSEDDDVNLNVNVKEVKILISPKRNVNIFTGLSSISEDKI